MKIALTILAIYLALFPTALAASLPSTMSSLAYTNATLFHTHKPRGATISVLDCTNKGAPWGFVCCAHNWAPLGMHCLFYDEPTLMIPEAGSCSKGPNRWDAGPFCGKGIIGKNGKPATSGIPPQQKFDVIKLSKSKINYGRYSPEGKAILQKAMNALYLHANRFGEPTDLSGDKHGKGGVVPELWAPKNPSKPTNLDGWDLKPTQELQGCLYKCLKTGPDNSVKTHEQKYCSDKCFAEYNAVEKPEDSLDQWLVEKAGCFLECKATEKQPDRQMQCINRCTGGLGDGPAA